MSGWFTNKHGVRCYMSSTGSHYGQRQPDGSFRTCLPVEVPRCCVECRFFDGGETGDYGEQLSPPYCEKNVPHFPTKTNRCGKQKLSGWVSERARSIGDVVYLSSYRFEFFRPQGQTDYFTLSGARCTIEGKAEPPFDWDIVMDGFGRTRVYDDELREPYSWEKGAFR